ncbi:MAG: hypothetical protein WD073_09045 [Xanthobacteraceae bacterium]
MTVLGHVHAVVTGMLNMLAGKGGGRLMLGLRCMIVGKGHDRPVRQAHEAEQHSHDDPKAWAKGPKRPHGFNLGVADCRRQLIFDNPGLILTLRGGRRMSAAMTTPAHKVFFRRRANSAPARDRM